MNLYLSNGRVWTGTQKDAKDAGPFVAVEVPTDKPGLLAWLNARWAERTVSAEPDVATMSDAEFDALDHQAIAEGMGFTQHTPPNLAPPPTNAGDCPACNRSARVAKIVANCDASMTAQAAIADVTDARSLDRIIAVAVARRAEL